jgi:3-oxoadipate enol-lactonase
LTHPPLARSLNANFFSIFEKAMQIGDRHFDSGGAQLRYRDEGSGPAVAFVHGWTLDLDAWDAQAAALAGSFRVVRHDRRGFGLSGGLPSLDADVEDLALLLDRLALGAAALVGLSQGARVALAFALRHPARVTALVLDGPPGETADSAAAGDEEFSIAAYRTLVRERGVDAFRRAWGTHPLMRLHRDDAAARELLARMLARYPALDLTEPAAAPRPAAGAGALARMEVPVLVVNGELDTPGRLRAGESIARAIPRAERVVMAGAGHLPNLDAPRAYNDAIEAFLRRQSRAAA